MSKVQSSTSENVLWKASQLLWSRETSYSAYVSCQNLLKRQWFKALVLMKLMTCIVVDGTSCRIIGRIFDTSAVYASVKSSESWWHVEILSPNRKTGCITKHHKYLICAWSTRISLLVIAVLLKETFYHSEGVDILSGVWRGLGSKIFSLMPSACI